MNARRLVGPTRLGLAVAWLIGLAGAGVPEKVVLRPQRGPDGRTVELSAPKGGAAVVVFYSPECPISNAYSPTLNSLVAQAPAGRVRFTGVCVDPDLTDAEVSAHLQDFGLKFPVVTDRRGTLAAALGATVTPEVFVLDDAGRVRYHGRIDDQFAGRRKANANPETHELADALAAVLAGRKVAVPHVPAVGCPLPEPPGDKPRPPG
jgi:peroxiredoxin